MDWLDKARFNTAQFILGKNNSSRKGIITPNGVGRSVSFSASLNTGRPTLTSLKNWRDLEKEYNTNPILSTVVNLKADYASNAMVNVRDLKTGEIYTDQTLKLSKNVPPLVKHMFKLKNNPNPLQSQKELLTTSSIFKDVFGNSFLYGNSGIDKINVRDVEFIWAVWPQFMNAVLTGKYFNAITSKEIIDKWIWGQGRSAREFKTEEILHRKDPNINLNVADDSVLGQSRQVSLQLPLSNIRIAYESRNVIAKERGMRSIISSDDKDSHMGSVPMEDDEKQEVQDDLRTYGFLEDQNQFMVTRHPIKVHNIDQDVRKLGLLNEISSDGMIVSQRYGLPKILMELSIKGATFENQDTAERRMYQNTTIPESDDFWEDMNVWLDTRNFGYEWFSSFEHIPVLQENRKDKAESDKYISAINKELFFAGAITYNEWLQDLKRPAIDEPWAKMRITQMSQKEIEIIKGNFTINRSLDEDEG